MAHLYNNILSDMLVVSSTDKSDKILCDPSDGGLTSLCLQI